MGRKRRTRTPEISTETTTIGGVTFHLDRVLGRHLMDRATDGRLGIDAGAAWPYLLLLADEDGQITQEAFAVWPMLAKSGAIDVRPFEVDPDFVRIRFRPYAIVRR